MRKGKKGERKKNDSSWFDLSQDYFHLSSPFPLYDEETT